MTVKNLIKELELWVADEENIVLREFFSKRGISDNELNELLENYKTFKNAYEKAQDKIEVRLVAGALTKKFNHTFVTYLLKNFFVKKSETNNQICMLSDDELNGKLKTLAQQILDESN